MDFKEFLKKEERVLPVFLLVDVSGSMSGQKISSVNVALKEMLYSLRNVANSKGLIKLSIITFGNDKVSVIKSLSEITDSEAYQLDAKGNTPMGVAFEYVSNLIEDVNIVSKRSYTPTIVLISDGLPTDYPGDLTNIVYDKLLEWSSLNQLLTGTRSSKALRVAMGIGSDYNYSFLKAFVNNPNIPVIKANDSKTIEKFFQWVTMSISMRSISANPNEAILAERYCFDDDEMEFL
jgi:uncharacterized protein YegL